MSDKPCTHCGRVDLDAFEVWGAIRAAEKAAEKTLNASRYFVRASEHRATETETEVHNVLFRYDDGERLILVHKLIHRQDADALFARSGIRLRAEFGSGENQKSVSEVVRYCGPAEIVEVGDVVVTVLHIYTKVDHSHCFASDGPLGRLRDRLP